MTPLNICRVTPMRMPTFCLWEKLRSHRQNSITPPEAIKRGRRRVEGGGCQGARHDRREEGWSETEECKEIDRKMRY